LSPMNIAVSSWCFRHMDVSRAIEEVASLGVRHVELFANTFHLDPRRGEVDTGRLERQLQRCGVLPLSLHLPFAGIGGGSEFRCRAAWGGLVDRCFALVGALGVSVVVHPQILCLEGEDPAGPVRTGGTDALPGPGRLKAVDAGDLVRGEVLAGAAALGACLVVENLPPAPYTAYRRCEETAALISRKDPCATGLCLDVSHSVFSGLDPVREIRAAGNRLREIHMSDNTPQAGADLHLPAGAGSVDWDSFFAELVESGFDGDIVLEIDGGKDPVPAVRASLDFLRRKLGSRGEI